MYSAVGDETRIMVRDEPGLPERDRFHTEQNGYCLMPTIESALVVLVPEAEVLVKPFRDRHEPSAAVGVPAHITCLYPFIAPDEIDSAVLDELRQCFERFLPFDFSLTGARRFPGVLYLSPEPAEPFRELTLAIWDRWPNTPPYGGQYSDIVPHLCVAQIADEPQLDAVAEEFGSASAGKLPIRATAREVALMDNTSGRWQLRTTFGL